MKRLIEQTACEHGKFENCGDASNVNHRWVKCPGGTSREVTGREAWFCANYSIVEDWDDERNECGHCGSGLCPGHKVLVVDLGGGR